MTTLGLSKLVHAHRNGLPVVVGTLTDAAFLGCRWIQGDPIPLRRGMFCGSAVEAGESWCGEHRRVVFGEDIASGPSVQAITTAKGKVTELAPPRFSAAYCASVPSSQTSVDGSNRQSGHQS